ncbi:hypothetical protein [Parapedobacter koreensis]|uniref:Uncharacterized protein n=1 Tax=Parapedobacter koreensis TaxID=332977 RepID=A0A1H7ME46_9SPHI|nr:hypothetical protein [Parapedobacter koreensis]SEL09473.1 hypothetical protein SAMN05421740_103479 [Parapedobacter koreensis]
MVSRHLGWYQRIYILCIAFHLSVMGVYNAWASLEGWYRGVATNGDSRWAAPLLQATRQVALYPTIHKYARLTGLNTGYTFFAPQVGSFYRYEVACADSDGGERSMVYHPPISGVEGYLRYQNFLELFQELLPNTPDDHPDKRFARAVARNMASTLLPDTCCHTRTLRVSAYAIRSLGASSNEPLLSLYTLLTDTIRKAPLP